MNAARSILVIRRDNIGDLVCTTPLLSALRRTHPGAWLGVLANSYNAPVLEGNSDIDAVFAYRKLKHLEAGENAFSALASRAATLWGLRRRKLDLIVLASGAQDSRGEKLARLLAPARVVRSAPARHGQHEVERTFSAAGALGIEGGIPQLRVACSADARSRIRAALDRAGLPATHPLFGVHISARRPAQRWPAERFAELIIAANEEFGAATLLLWSPGRADHAKHPGDDEKANAIAGAVGGKAALLPWPTTALADLIGALSMCDLLVCSDGGAMHLAAGLGKPIACFFGDSPVARWRPWGVRHVILQATSHKVEDVPVEQAMGAIAALLRDRPES